MSYSDKQPLFPCSSRKTKLFSQAADLLFVGALTDSVDCFGGVETLKKSVSLSLMGVSLVKLIARVNSTL